MKHCIQFLTMTLFLCSFSINNLIAQEETGVFSTSVQYKGNNSNDPDDVSGLTGVRMTTPEEERLINEIRTLRQKNDRTLRDKIQALEKQLDDLNPNSISKPGEYYEGMIYPAGDEKSFFTPEAIGNVEIFNSGTAFISSHATATEQIGTTAGKIWVVFSIRTTGGADTLRFYYSDNNGSSWVYYAWGKLGGTDQINYDEMDLEIIEESTGEKYLWVTYGYRESAGSGRWRTGGVVVQTPTLAGQFFALSWPGDDATKRYYRLRVTSDNATYPTIAYIYMVASFDSSAGSSRVNTQKTLRCTNPYTTTPTFQYKADRFWWNSQVNNYQRDLHSDIAYFQNGSDSIIVSFSNVPDSTRLFFAKSNISNGPGTPNGAGGFIGGSQPSDHKQFARISSNGNDNGSVIAVFRQNTNSRWRITYFRTTNHGNFNNMNQAALQGSVTSDSYQPDIVGVRNMPKHYFTWRVDGNPDSIRYIGTTHLGIWDQFVGMMNSQTSLSGLVGPKPGFRYTDNDSCFVSYVPTGPYDIWAAFGCQDGITPSTTLTAPNGGEVWGVGLSENITWASEGVANVKIELSTNNGSSWTNVIESTPSSGTYSWTIPNSPSTECLIRISDVGNPSTFDQSNAVFEITLTPGVEDELNGIPNTYTLLQNYPNPFNPNTTIYYGLPQESSVNFMIYDILGNELFKITEEQKPAGYHKVIFDASNLRSGVYFYRLEAGDYVETRKMVLMK